MSKGWCEVPRGGDYASIFYDIGPHDWRLISERLSGGEFEQQEGASPGYGTTVFHTQTQRWYCTRCRVIEETTSPS